MKVKVPDMGDGVFEVTGENAKLVTIDVLGFNHLYPKSEVTIVEGEFKISDKILKVPNVTQELCESLIEELINQHEYLCDCQKDEKEHTVKLEIGWRIQQIEKVLLHAGVEL